MGKTLLIDADSIAYKKADKVLLHARPAIGFEVEEGEVIGTTSTDVYVESHYDAETEEPYEVECDVEVATQEVQAFIDELLEVSGCDDYLLLLTAGRRTEHLFMQAEPIQRPHIEHPEHDVILVEGHEFKSNFRYAVADALQHGYKHNRIQKPLHGYMTIMRTMSTKFKSMWFDYIEADDAVIAMYNSDPEKYMISAMDKDVLNQVPGMHIDYHKLGQTADEWEYFTGIEKALYYKYYQAIVGDPTDGYKGVPRIGKKTVSKWINEEMTEKELWDATVRAFASKGLTEEMALATLRLASMHQTKFDGEKFIVELEKPVEF